MSRKAQSLLEYIVLIAVITVGLFAMQVYLKRGMQGRLKGSVETLTEGGVYSPGATRSFSKSTTSSQENTEFTSNAEVSVSTSDAEIRQLSNRDEEVLSFGSEPRRW